MPMATSANGAPCTMRLTMLPAVRKRSFWTWKTTQMMSRPTMIGRLPSSPPRTLSTQRLAYAPSVAVGAAAGVGSGGVMALMPSPPRPGRGPSRACRR